MTRKSPAVRDNVSRAQGLLLSVKRISEFATRFSMKRPASRISLDWVYLLPLTK